LFVKSVREDARGHFRGLNQYQSNLNLDEQFPSSSLRLDEVVLLTNEDADKLATQDGIRPAGSTGTAVPALTPNTADNAASNDALLRNSDTFFRVLDTYDLAADTRIREFVNQRALKRVLFNYSYRLCPGTPNSFANLAQLPAMDLASAHLGRSGKLTLESISTYGPLNTKLIPDFKFAYANNPAYGREQWDGFGMYNSGGYASGAGHAISSNHEQASADGAAWSLTEIVNPLGSRTQIAYERDQYANVSESGAKKLIFTNNDGSNTLDVQGFNGNLTDHLRVGDSVTVQGSNDYRVRCNIGTDENPIWRYRPCNVNYAYKRLPISAVTATKITFKFDSWPNPTCQQSTNSVPCGDLEAEGANLAVYLPSTTEGGDIRVASVSTLDEHGTRYQVRYRYAHPQRPAASTSSGVISKLPEFVTRDVKLPFYALYDYPGTSVMYGRVTVLRGKFGNNADADHEQREEYAFYTPDSRMVRVTQDDDSPSAKVLGRKQIGINPLTGAPIYKTRYIEQRDNRITVNVGKIGQPIAIQKYNRRGELELASQFGYTGTMPNPEGIAGQGSFTEGVLTSELLDRSIYRVNRTTKKYVPVTLVATTTMANGMKTVSRSTLYDFLTGQVLETTAQNSLGDTYVTKTVPAYTLAPYADMGPKGENSVNRNMLTQTAGSYVYKQTGTNTRQLIAASVQTWNKDWRTYRGYGDGDYRDESAAKPTWRQWESYVWNGARLNSDGTFASFVDYNWAQPAAGQVAGWLKAGEVLRYDHYSKPLEVVDMNGQYAATKARREDGNTLASAANARYVEMAYSGAEDRVLPDPATPATQHFGGEVRDGSRRDVTHHHAGRYSSKLSSGEEGFTYRAPVGGATGIRGGRQYRLSVWLHKSDAGVNGGRLYAKLNTTVLGETSISAPTTKKAGNWYLLNLYVKLAAGATGQLTAGCRNTGPNPVYADDFRFHPLQGSMTAYNYDPHTSQVTYVLNNENLYTKYEYDAAGKVIKVFKETLDRLNDASPTEKLVVENSYNYARMREPNWVLTGAKRCETNEDGSPSGLSSYERRDVNPRSSTYNQLKWEGSEYSTDCPTCTGERRKWIGGECETPTYEGCVGSVPRGNGTFLNTYRYSYSDGTHEDDPRIETGQCAF
jgi:hypothetical protein